MDEWKQFLQSTEMSLRIMDTIYDERVLTEITSQIRQHIKFLKELRGTYSETGQIDDSGFNSVNYFEDAYNFEMA